MQSPGQFDSSFGEFLISSFSGADSHHHASTSHSGAGGVPGSGDASANASGTGGAAGGDDKSKDNGLSYRPQLVDLFSSVGVNPISGTITGSVLVDWIQKSGLHCEKRALKKALPKNMRWDKLSVEDCSTLLELYERSKQDAVQVEMAAEESHLGGGGGSGVISGSQEDGVSLGSKSMQEGSRTGGVAAKDRNVVIISFPDWIRQKVGILSSLDLLKKYRPREYERVLRLRGESQHHDQEDTQQGEEHMFDDVDSIPDHDDDVDVAEELAERLLQNKTFTWDPSTFKMGHRTRLFVSAAGVFIMIAMAVLLFMSLLWVSETTTREEQVMIEFSESFSLLNSEFFVRHLEDVSAELIDSATTDANWITREWVHAAQDQVDRTTADHLQFAAGMNRLAHETMLDAIYERFEVVESLKQVLDCASSDEELPLEAVVHILKGFARQSVNSSDTDRYQRFGEEEEGATSHPSSALLFDHQLTAVEYTSTKGTAPAVMYQHSDDSVVPKTAASAITRSVAGRGIVSSTSRQGSRGGGYGGSKLGSAVAVRGLQFCSKRVEEWAPANIPQRVVQSGNINTLSGVTIEERAAAHPTIEVRLVSSTTMQGELTAADNTILVHHHRAEKSVTAQAQDPEGKVLNATHIESVIMEQVRAARIATNTTFFMSMAVSFVVPTKGLAVCFEFPVDELLAEQLREVSAAVLEVQLAHVDAVRVQAALFDEQHAEREKIQSWNGSLNDTPFLQTLPKETLLLLPADSSHMAVSGGLDAWDLVGEVTTFTTTTTEQPSGSSSSSYQQHFSTSSTLDKVARQVISGRVGATNSAPTFALDDELDRELLSTVAIDSMMPITGFAGPRGPCEGYNLPHSTTVEFSALPKRSKKCLAFESSMLGVYRHGSQHDRDTVDVHVAANGSASVAGYDGTEVYTFASYIPALDAVVVSIVRKQDVVDNFLAQVVLGINAADFYGEKEVLVAAKLPDAVRLKKRYPSLFSHVHIDVATPVNGEMVASPLSSLSSGAARLDAKFFQLTKMAKKCLTITPDGSERCARSRFAVTNMQRAFELGAEAGSEIGINYQPTPVMGAYAALDPQLHVAIVQELALETISRRGLSTLIRIFNSMNHLVKDKTADGDEIDCRLVRRLGEPLSQTVDTTAPCGVNSFCLKGSVKKAPTNSTSTSATTSSSTQDEILWRSDCPKCIPKRLFEKGRTIPEAHQYAEYLTGFSDLWQRSQDAEKHGHDVILPQYRPQTEELYSELQPLGFYHNEAVAKVAEMNSEHHQSSSSPNSATSTVVVSIADEHVRNRYYRFSSDPVALRATQQEEGAYKKDGKTVPIVARDMRDYRNQDVFAVMSRIEEYNTIMVIVIPNNKAEGKVTTGVTAAVLLSLLPLVAAFGFLVFLTQFVYRRIENSSHAAVVELDMYKNQFYTHVENIVPPFIKSKMLQGHRLVSQYHKDVSISFIDMIDTNEVTRSWTPKQIVGYVNYYAFVHHEVSKRYSVTILKIFGDAVVGVAGLETCYGGAAAIASAGKGTCALNLAKYAEIMIQLHDPVYRHCPHKFENFHTAFPNDDIVLVNPIIRVGLHFGPVFSGSLTVGGVPRFDCYGASMMLANRMRSTSLPMRIHCTVQFKDILHSVDYNDVFEFEPPRKTVVKGQSTISSFLIYSAHQPMPPEILSSLGVVFSQQEQNFADVGDVDTAETGTTNRTHSSSTTSKSDGSSLVLGGRPNQGFSRRTHSSNHSGSGNSSASPSVRSGSEGDR